MSFKTAFCFALRCLRPISDPTKTYGPYCEWLLGLSSRNSLSDVLPDGAGTGDKTVLDNASTVGYTGNVLKTAYSNGLAYTQNSDETVQKLYNAYTKYLDLSESDTALYKALFDKYSSDTPAVAMAPYNTYNGNYLTNLSADETELYKALLDKYSSDTPTVEKTSYNAYEGNNLLNNSEFAKVAWGENWGESFGSWLEKRWNDVKWAFEKVGYYANEAQKKAQRSVWKAGCDLYLKKKNLLTSAWMLEHSLQDNPEDIWRGNDSRIAYLINHDKKFSEEVRLAIQNSDGKELRNKKIGVLFDDGDLSYSIHKSDICLTGYKQDNGKWIINCKLSDEYDFTEIMTFMDSEGGWSKHIGKATIANDAAVISQKLGAITPYHVTVDFWITR